jgi:hypothetical protein
MMLHDLASFAPARAVRGSPTPHTDRPKVSRIEETYGRAVSARSETCAEHETMRQFPPRLGDSPSTELRKIWGVLCLIEMDVQQTGAAKPQPSGAMEGQVRVACTRHRPLALAT